MTVHGVGKISDIFAGKDIDESHPTKSNVDGIQKTEQLLQELDEGFIFTNLVETDSLWGHRNDPVNFHRCLQDFDRRLPDLLEALRPGDLLILTSDHGCDPTTPSTDHSREHAMLLRTSPAQRVGADPRGRVRGCRRDGQCLARGKSALAGNPGATDPDSMKLDNPTLVGWEYASEERFAKRTAIFHALLEGGNPDNIAYEAVAETKPRRVLDVGCGLGGTTERFVKELGADVQAIDLSPRMVELTSARKHAQSPMFRSSFGDGN